jgi:hypothetical protein
MTTPATKTEALRILEYALAKTAEARAAAVAALAAASHPSDKIALADRIRGADERILQVTADKEKHTKREV